VTDGQLRLTPGVKVDILPGPGEQQQVRTHNHNLHKTTLVPALLHRTPVGAAEAVNRNRFCG